MKRLLNTLYITSLDSYLSLDGENIIITRDDGEKSRYPLHNLESIIAFGSRGASPALMGKCAENSIGLCFLSRLGKFQARIVGKSRGNVLLRKEQYAISNNEIRSLSFAKNMIIGKIYNSKWLLERYTRDHAMRVNVEAIKAKSVELSEILGQIKESRSLEELRGFEGRAATSYFSVFDDLILNQKDEFFFHGRNKRPPLDRVNCLLSFLYTILANNTMNALEGVGLDAYVGFFHQDRPGRASLALDMMEELRSAMVDRLVLSMINKKQIGPDDFEQEPNGAILMDDDTRKAVLSAWHVKNQEKIQHPFLDEKISWGLVPYAQAMLLARQIRGDLDEYPPFLWK